MLNRIKKAYVNFDRKMTGWIVNNPAEATMALIVWGAVCNEAGHALRNHLNKKSK